MKLQNIITEQLLMAPSILFAQSRSPGHSFSFPHNFISAVIEKSTSLIPFYNKIKGPGSMQSFLKTKELLLQGPSYLQGHEMITLFSIESIWPQDSLKLTNVMALCATALLQHTEDASIKEANPTTLFLLTHGVVNGATTLPQLLGPGIS